MSMSKKLVVVGAALVAVAAAASFAFAAIPDSNGVIHGCYKKDSGAVRVFDSAVTPPKSCTDKEAPINWSASGISGLQMVAASTNDDSTSLKKVSVSCPPGKVRISGGADISAFGWVPVALTRSAPSGPGVEKWNAEAREVAPTSDNWALSVDIICAYASYSS